MQMTILNGETATTFESADGASMNISDLPAATGWQLKPEGLCQGDICVPVRDQTVLLNGAAINIEAFAAAVHRPVVLDTTHRVAALGESATAVAQQLRDGRAPDFTLNDIHGVAHTMSAIGRKKKVLVVWSSW